MALFTIVFDFDGGTYISQVRAASVKGVIKKYAANLIANDAIGTLSTRQKLALSIEDEEPVAIEGVRNVWCFCASAGKKFGIINVVATLE